MRRLPGRTINKILATYGKDYNTKNIEATALDHSAYENMPTEIALEKSMDQLPVYSGMELDRQINELKKTHNFLKQRAEDLEEVLPDPLFAMFD